MNKRLCAGIMLIPFMIVSALAVMEVGYIGIFEHATLNAAGWQLGVDLIIALLLVFMWIVPDAKEKGRNPWPYFAITLAMGSLGPLLYLLMGGDEQSAEHGA